MLKMNVLGAIFLHANWCIKTRINSDNYASVADDASSSQATTLLLEIATAYQGGVSVGVPCLHNSGRQPDTSLLLNDCCMY